jgi:hypothetical protein
VIATLEKQSPEIPMLAADREFAIMVPAKTQLLINN